MPSPVGLRSALTGHSSGATDARVSPDGRRIASASLDGMRLWETASGRLLATPTGHTDRVTACRFGGDALLSGSRDGALRLWDVEALSAGGGSGLTGGAALEVVARAPDGALLIRTRRAPERPDELRLHPREGPVRESARAAAVPRTGDLLPFAVGQIARGGRQGRPAHGS